MEKLCLIKNEEYNNFLEQLPNYYKDQSYFIGSYARYLVTDKQEKYKDIDIAIFVDNKNFNYLLYKLNICNIKKHYNSLIGFLRVKTNNYYDLLIFNKSGKIPNIETLVSNSTFNFEMFYIEYKTGKVFINNNIYNDKEELKYDIINKIGNIAKHSEPLLIFNTLKNVNKHINKYKEKGYTIKGKLQKEFLK